MSDAVPVVPSTPPGWYADPEHAGSQRYWDGAKWTEHRAPAAAPAAQMAQPAVRQAADRAQYVRQQKGHSLILHLLLGVFVLWIPAIYISVSPNHYWHA